MELNQILAEAINNTKASLWPAFAPELILCLTIFLMLIVRLFNFASRINVYWIALIGSLVALFFAAPWEHLAPGGELPRYELFTGMLVYDSFTVFIRAILILFAVLFTIFTRLSGIPDKYDSADFYCMVLGAIIGMCLMASANHLLVVFMAVEMASVPSYALAAMQKGRRQSSEAALKYSIYGAGAAGVMLYGISLLSGMLHTAHLPTIALQLAEMLPAMGGSERMVLALAGLMIAVGLAFKLSAVPFHFWCPDVFEGASAEINAFLSVASKAGALALLVRICLGIGLIPSTPVGPPPADQAVETATLNAELGIGTAAFSVGDSLDKANPEVMLAKGDDTAAAATVGSDNLAPVRTFIAYLVAFIAVITSTFGNLAAYGQTNIKRLLAYSTVAHAGYMMLPVPVAMMLAKSHPEIAEKAIASLALYMSFYLFMNLSAFAIVAFLRNMLNSEEIADYAGLVKRTPGIVVCFAIVLFSLVGIPPLAGFIGKFAIFASLAEGYQASGFNWILMLLVFGGLNTVLSLFYYLRVVKVMAIDPEPDRATSTNWSMVSMGGAFIALVTFPLILFFIKWDLLNEWTITAARNLL